MDVQFITSVAVCERYGLHQAADRGEGHNESPCARRRADGQHKG